MPKRKETTRPALRYDPQSNRYRDERGRFVSRRAILDAVDAIERDTSGRLNQISVALKEGRITLAAWQTEFRDTIRAAHTLAAGIAMGGKKNMTPSDWGRIGQQLRIQYEALNRFALQIEQGATVNLGRVEQYARAVRNTFLNAERLRRPVNQRARWIRTARESCAGCIEQSAKGVQLAASFPPLGSRQCRHNCRCFLQYIKLE